MTNLSNYNVEFMHFRSNLGISQTDIVNTGNLALSTLKRIEANLKPTSDLLLHKLIKSFQTLGYLPHFIHFLRNYKIPLPTNTDHYKDPNFFSITTEEKDHNKVIPQLSNTDYMMFEYPENVE